MLPASLLLAWHGIFVAPIFTPLQFFRKQIGSAYEVICEQSLRPKHAAKPQRRTRVQFRIWYAKPYEIQCSPRWCANNHMDTLLLLKA